MSDSDFVLELDGNTIFDEMLRLFGPDGKGWTKGTFHRHRLLRRDQYCLLGALTQVEDDDYRGWYYPARALLAEHITGDSAAEYRITGFVVEGFNDRSETTWPDVKRLLEACAADPRAREMTKE
jgi:hypothetical protein